MAVELPEPLQWVLLLLAGCRWPEADEDQLRDMADHCRKAAETLRDAGQGVDAAIKRAVDGQQGQAAEALTTYWATYTVGKGTKDDPGRLTATINALDGMGDMLEQVANSAETAKIQIVAQLGILAFELATAEAEAPITAGASMAQVPGFIAAARAFVQTTLKTLLKDMVKMAAKQAAQMAAINLMAQGIELAEGHRKSIDWKEVGENAKGGAIGGAAGHLIGAGLGGAAAKMGLGHVANSAGGKMAIGAATGVGADAATQYITTGKVDTSTLLGSGLSGGAGAGLSHIAQKHAPPAAPKPGDAPHIPGPVGPGEGGRQDGPPKFSKPDTSSGDSGGSYHGPSGESSSGSNSGGGKSSSDSFGPSSSNSGSGNSGSGDSKVGGLSRFGSGRSSGDAPPSYSEATGGGRGHEQASPPPSYSEATGGGRGHEQASPPPSYSEATGGGRGHEQASPSHEQASPSHEQSTGGGNREQASPPPSYSEATGGGRGHEQASPSHEQASPSHEQSTGGGNREQAEATRPMREPLGEQTPSRPAHEQAEAVRPSHEPLGEQTPSRPAHEQAEAVRPSHEPLAEQTPSRPAHEQAQPSHEQSTGGGNREQAEAVRPSREPLAEQTPSRPAAHESLAGQEPSRPAHNDTASAPGRDNSPSGHESSANDRDSVQPSGDDSASRPSPAAGPVPNLSGVLGGAAHLAGASSSSGHGSGSGGGSGSGSGGTHLDGARSATLPRPDGATVPGQAGPELHGDAGPNTGAQSPNQGAVPPMGGAGFTPGPVGGGGGSHSGGGHSSGGARPDAPSSSGARRPVGDGSQQQGGGTIRPGGGRGTGPEPHAATPKPSEHSGPKPTEHNGPKPTDHNAPKPTEHNGPKPTDHNAPKPTDHNAPKPTDHNAPKPHDSSDRPTPHDRPEGEPRPHASDKRPIDVPGGLKEPTAHDRQRIEDAVPRDENGNPKTHPNPMEGDWVKHLNGDGFREPGRSNNCADAALSFLDTYNGHPTAAAPRVENNGAGEKGGRDRIEQALGGRFEHQGGGDEGHANLRKTLLESGPGSQAVIISADGEGRSHAWNVVNQDGKIVYADPQMGRTSEKPLYAGEGGLFAVPVKPDGSALHPTDRPNSAAGNGDHQSGGRPEAQPKTEPESHQDAHSGAGPEHEASPESEQPHPGDEPGALDPDLLGMLGAPHIPSLDEMKSVASKLGIPEDKLPTMVFVPDHADVWTPFSEYGDGRVHLPESAEKLTIGDLDGFKRDDPEIGVNGTESLSGVAVIIGKAGGAYVAGKDPMSGVLVVNQRMEKGGFSQDHVIQHELGHHKQKLDAIDIDKTKNNPALIEYHNILTNEVKFHEDGKTPRLTYQESDGQGTLPRPQMNALKKKLGLSEDLPEGEYWNKVKEMGRNHDEKKMFDAIEAAFGKDPYDKHPEVKENFAKAYLVEYLNNPDTASKPATTHESSSSTSSSAQDSSSTTTSSSAQDSSSSSAPPRRQAPPPPPSRNPFEGSSESQSSSSSAPPRRQAPPPPPSRATGGESSTPHSSSSSSTASPVENPFADPRASRPSSSSSSATSSSAENPFADPRTPRPSSSDSTAPATPGGLGESVHSGPVHQDGQTVHEGVEHGGGQEQQHNQHEGGAGDHENPGQSHEGGPRQPATDGRPFDVEGGLKRPSEHEERQLQDAVPRNEDGSPQRHPDPFQGDWVKKLNGDGLGAPGRANNCSDVALSVIDTYSGHPTVAAPRTENNSVGERGSRDRIEHALGAKFEKLGEGPAAHEKLAQTLRESGPGSSAAVITHDSEGRAHAWNVVNHDGKIVYVDGQMGKVSDRPLYQGEGGLFAVPLAPDRSPLHPTTSSGAEHGNDGQTGAHSGTGDAARPDADPGAGNGGRGYKVDSKEVLDEIGNFLPSDKRAEFDGVKKDLLDYNRADLDSNVNRAMVNEYRQQKDLHVDLLRKSLPGALEDVKGRLADPATSAHDRANLEKVKAGLEEQQQRLDIYEHELARRTGGKNVADLAGKREAAEKHFGADVERRITEEKATVADLVKQAEEKRKQAKDEFDKTKKTKGDQADHKSANKGFTERIEELKRREKQLDDDLKLRKDAQQQTFPAPGRESLQKSKDEAYRAAFGYSEHGVMAGEPHAEKVERGRTGDIGLKFEPVSLNRNHIVADFMVHKYVAAAVFKGRALGPETHATVSEAFGDFVRTMAPDNHRVLDRYGKEAAGRLATDSHANEVLVRRDLGYTKDTVDLKNVYGSKELPDAIRELGSATDHRSAHDAVADLQEHLSEHGLDGPVRRELAELKSAAGKLDQDAPTGEQLQKFRAAADKLDQKVRQQAVEDVSLTNGITGPRQVDEAVSALRDAGKHAHPDLSGGPERTTVKDLYPGLDRQLDGLADKFGKEGLDGGPAAALAEKLRNRTETQADFDNLAKHLNDQREPLRTAEIDKHLAELRTENSQKPEKAVNTYGDDLAKAKEANDKKAAEHAAAHKDLQTAETARDKAKKTYDAAAAAAGGNQKDKALVSAEKALNKAESKVAVAEKEFGKATSALEEADLSLEVATRANDRFEELRKGNVPPREAQAITDHETMGTYYGGTHARQGSTGVHPEALFEQALKASPAELPRLIERMANSLSDSGSNLRFGDEFTNQLVQNYLDPHLIRDPEVLTAVAEGKLPKEALYSPHTLDLLRAVRGLEDKGLAPRELRQMMEPKTAADVASKVESPGIPTPLSNNAVAEFGVDTKNPNAHVPLSSSGNPSHRPGDKPSTAVVDHDFKQGYYDPARDGAPGAEGSEITVPKPKRDADGDTVMSSQPNDYNKRGRGGDSDGEPPQKRRATGQDADGDTAMDSPPSSPTSTSSAPTTQMNDLHLFSQDPAGVFPPSHETVTPHGEQAPHEQQLHEQAPHEQQLHEQAPHEQQLHEQAPHEQQPHEQASHDRQLTENQDAGPRHPATDGRPFDTQGGLKRPSEHEVKQLQDAVPHHADGTPQRHPDPLQGDWMKKLNGDGPGAPGRTNNCVDAALSLVDTYSGHPTVAAPRHENNGLGETAGRDRVEQALGGRFESLGTGEEGHANLAQTLLDGGHGSQAVIISRDGDGRTHAWNAMNHEGKIVYGDPQLGRTSETPLYAGETGLFALPVGPDRAPLHSGDRPAGQHVAPSEPAGTGREIRKGNKLADAVADAKKAEAAREAAAGRKQEPTARDKRRADEQARPNLSDRTKERLTDQQAVADRKKELTGRQDELADRQNRLSDEQWKLAEERFEARGQQDQGLAARQEQALARQDRWESQEKRLAGQQERLAEQHDRLARQQALVDQGERAAAKQTEQAPAGSEPDARQKKLLEDQQKLDGRREKLVKDQRQLDHEQAGLDRAQQDLDARHDKLDVLREKLENDRGAARNPNKLKELDAEQKKLDAEQQALGKARTSLDQRQKWLDRSEWLVDQHGRLTEQELAAKRNNWPEDRKKALADRRDRLTEWHTEHTKSELKAEADAKAKAAKRGEDPGLHYSPPGEGSWRTEKKAWLDGQLAGEGKWHSADQKARLEERLDVLKQLNEAGTKTKEQQEKLKQQDRLLDEQDRLAEHRELLEDRQNHKDGDAEQLKWEQDRLAEEQRLNTEAQHALETGDGGTAGSEQPQAPGKPLLVDNKAKGRYYREGPRKLGNVSIEQAFNVMADSGHSMADGIVKDARRPGCVASAVYVDGVGGARRLMVVTASSTKGLAGEGAPEHVHPLVKFAYGSEGDPAYKSIKDELKWDSYPQGSPNTRCKCAEATVMTGLLYAIDGQRPLDMSNPKAVTDALARARGILGKTYVRPLETGAVAGTGARVPGYGEYKAPCKNCAPVVEYFGMKSVQLLE